MVQTALLIGANVLLLSLEWRLRDVYQLEHYSEEYQMYVPCRSARGIYWARFLAWLYGCRVTRFGRVV